MSYSHHGDSKYGSKNYRMYRMWANMKIRCFYKKSKDYSRYGGRGIKVCNEWKDSYLSFKKWSENNGYRNDLTLERIDVNKDYSPKNCTFATMKEQQNNRRDNIKYKGESVLEAANRLGCRTSTIYQRIFSYSWPLEEAFNRPVSGRI